MLSLIVKDVFFGNQNLLDSWPCIVGLPRRRSNYIGWSPKGLTHKVLDFQKKTIPRLSPRFHLRMLWQRVRRRKLPKRIPTVFLGAVGFGHSSNTSLQGIQVATVALATFFRSGKSQIACMCFLLELAILSGSWNARFVVWLPGQNSFRDSQCLAVFGRKNVARSTVSTASSPFSKNDSWHISLVQTWTYADTSDDNDPQQQGMLRDPMVRLRHEFQWLRGGVLATVFT